MISLKKMDELIQRYRKSINPPYKFKDYLNLAITFLILLALPVTILLVKQEQDIRQRAQEETPTSQSPPTPESPQSVPDEILIKFKPGVDEEAKDHIRKHFGVKKEDEISQIGVEIGKVPEKAKDKIIEALKHNPRVEYAEPNHINQAVSTPNDTYFSRQWNLSKIAAPSGWDISTGSVSVKVAVLDTGLDVTHEDLIGKYIDLFNNPTNLDDVYGHGTAVAGIVGAATNNGKGIASVGYNVTIMPIKIANSGSTSDSTIASATVIAADNGAKAINISWGGYSNSSTMQSAVNYAWNKGVVVVAAAGNDNTSGAFYPAAGDNVVAVGGSDSYDQKSNISNYGPWLDVMAPVVAITTTMAGSYDFAGGTSMASPHVAGLAGLILSANPNLSNAQVVDIILHSADDLTTTVGRDDLTGWGRINVGRALQQATGTTGVLPDTTSPQGKITSPANGTTVADIVDITADVIDNVGVTNVGFYARSTTSPYTETFLGSDTTSPYSLSWDTSKITNGPYQLYLRMSDAAGNTGSTFDSSIVPNNTLTVTVYNPSTPDTTPPTASITSPSNDSAVSGSVYISATVTDDVGVSSASLLVDGAFYAQMNSNAFQGYPSWYTLNWNSTQVSNGNHTLQVTALDPANNLGQSSSITVSVNNVTSSPSPTPSPTSTPTQSVPTPTPTPNLQTGVVTFSGISVSTTGTSATINWTTNIVATSKVIYGLSSTSLTSSSAENTNLSTSHSVILTGFTPNTRYYYKAVSKNSLGDTFSSTVKSFKTKSR